MRHTQCPANKPAASPVTRPLIPGVSPRSTAPVSEESAWLYTSSTTIKPSILLHNAHMWLNAAPKLSLRPLNGPRPISPSRLACRREHHPSSCNPERNKHRRHHGRGLLPASAYIMPEQHNRTRAQTPTNKFQSGLTHDERKSKSHAVPVRQTGTAAITARR